MEVINIQDKLAKFSDHWNPRIIAELNNQYVKIAKIQGEFVWHAHENEDEMFYVIEGELTIEFRDKSVKLSPGECLVVPRGVEHRPVCDEEVSIILFEPKTTINTGEINHKLTNNNLETI